MAKLKSNDPMQKKVGMDRTLYLHFNGVPAQYVQHVLDYEKPEADAGGDLESENRVTPCINFGVPVAVDELILNLVGYLFLITYISREAEIGKPRYNPDAPTYELRIAYQPYSVGCDSVASPEALVSIRDLVETYTYKLKAYDNPKRKDSGVQGPFVLYLHSPLAVKRGGVDILVRNKNRTKWVPMMSRREKLQLVMHQKQYYLTTTA